MFDIDELWRKIRFDLKAQLAEEVYQSYFEPLDKISSFSNNNIYLVVKSSFERRTINNLYLDRINALIKKYCSEPVRIKFITTEEKQEMTNPSNKTRQGVGKYKQDIEPEFNFRTFVSGKSNSFAHRTAQIVADQLVSYANPFYIMGDVGLGKTHLMKAIGNAVLDADGSKVVRYAKADVFIEDFARFSHARASNKVYNIDEMNEKYRNVDLLLFDDIQLLKGSEGTQKEFFRIFEDLISRRVQIVITSDKPANKLQGIQERLQSRLSNAITVTIDKPDFDLKVKIINKKLVEEYPNTPVPEDVINFIASSFFSNIREIEGALRTIITYAMVFEKQVTLDITKEALKDILSNKSVAESLDQTNYERIISCVADYYRISFNDLIGPSRVAKYTEPRHIAMFLIKDRYKNIPFKTIGMLFSGRDHSSVMAAIEKIETKTKTDLDLKQVVTTLSKKLSIN